MKSKNTSRSFDGNECRSTLSDRISGWIAACVGNAGLKGAILGLSGGVDSAVVAALCRKALGSRVTGLILPCESVIADEEDALLTAKTFGVQAITVRLDGTFRALLDVLPDASPQVRANLKPRLRMAVLYYWANKLSYMVVGTGNKSEIMAGYFTKYGDGGVDLLPLGSIFKDDVLKLAAELGVPGRIVAKPPSAGLWAGQTDEGEMGISYDDLDRTLRAIEAGGPDGGSPEIFERVAAMHAGSEHKRRPPLVYGDAQ